MHQSSINFEGEVVLNIFQEEVCDFVRTVDCGYKFLKTKKAHRHNEIIFLMASLELLLFFGEEIKKSFFQIPWSIKVYMNLRFGSLQLLFILGNSCGKIKA